MRLIYCTGITMKQVKDYPGSACCPKKDFHTIKYFSQKPQMCGANFVVFCFLIKFCRPQLLYSTDNKRFFRFSTVNY